MIYGRREPRAASYYHYDFHLSLNPSQTTSYGPAYPSLHQSGAWKCSHRKNKSVSAKVHGSNTNEINGASAPKPTKAEVRTKELHQHTVLSHDMFSSVASWKQWMCSTHNKGANEVPCSWKPCHCWRAAYRCVNMTAALHLMS